MSERPKGGDMPKQALSPEAVAPPELDDLNFGAALYGADGRILAVNDYFCELLGARRDEALGATLDGGIWDRLELAYEDGSRPTSKNNIVLRVMRTGKPVVDTVLRVCHNGKSECRWVQASGFPRHGADGKISGCFVTAWDITEHRRLAEELQLQKAMLDETGRIAKVGGWRLDTETSDGFWTAEAARIFDLDPALPVSRGTSLQYYTDEARPVIAAAVDEAIASQTPYDLELEVVTATGTRKWVRTIGHPVVQDGLVVGLFGSIQDITEQKQNEEAKAASEERFLKAFNASPASQWIASLDGDIFEANEAFCQMTGYTHKELVGCNSLVIGLFEDTRARAERLAEISKSGRLRGSEFRIGIKNGEYRDVLCSVECLDWNGVPAAISSALDVTEQKKMETERTALQQQLFEVQKMETIGQLAGGIAHDFNNILMVQRGYCELMRLSLKEDDPLTKGLAQIESYIDKASALTGQLLAFSRKQPLKLEVFDLNNLVEDMELTLQRVAGEHVRLITELAVHPATVEADRTQMQQVLVTLTANARQSLQEGGKVSISIAWEDSATETEGVGGTIPAGKYVVVSVGDTGPGLGAEAARRLFEPFYKGNERRRDSGLGLSAVYGIVRQSGGHIVAQSELGQGTKVLIYLPRVEAWVAASPAPDIAPKTGGQTVLVVEDEPTLRELIVAMVRQLGYEVKEAGNGSQALALVEREHLVPDLLLTDVVMPEIGGVSLVGRLRDDMPELKVIFMSGYASESTEDLGFGDPRTAFLRKPFSLSALEGQIKALLGPIVYH